MDKRAVGDRIIKRNGLLEMRSRWGKPACRMQMSTEGKMPQDEPGGIVALAAKTQQILVHAQRQIEFAAGRVIARLPQGDMKER